VDIKAVLNKIHGGHSPRRKDSGLFRKILGTESLENDLVIERLGGEIIGKSEKKKREEVVRRRQGERKRGKEEGRARKKERK